MNPCALCPHDEEGCHECCERAPHFYIRQKLYTPVKGARMEVFEPKTIRFRKGGICGIPVKDGIERRYQGLENRDSRPFEGMDVADQPLLRIEWPGYKSWNTSFRTRDTRAPKMPVSLSRLATYICTGIEKFVQEMEGVEYSDKDLYRVGRNTQLNVDTLALVALRRVSYGSWMASIVIR